ncbi:LysR family transcriptional regulator [Legionella quateirensis]|uniref:Transcriptional regulator n=1 Tax=Legionella quateirensis TaxID=45072 RepID=A0A378KVZ6_9GAMM|nr:LysR family transcriptional regulator [Legionella quateirensis]KTD47532.1 transcriptional regulator [Legionella quateirensis]STY18713.1 transcriptional regulator [Legionella quateirensis]
MNTLGLIHTFCKVAQCANFTVAAKVLNRSAAAVSKQISLLESSLGVMLLHRTTRQVSLTEIGEAYYREAQSVLLALDKANGVVASAKQEPTGLLRVKSSRYFADNYILPRLNEYMNKYPQVTIDLQIAEHIPDLLEEDLDVVFGMSAQVASNSVQKKITTTRYVFCASPAYLGLKNCPDTPSDLSSHNYITHTMRRPNDAWTFPSGETVYLLPVLYLNDAQAMLDSAIKGLGIVALHHYQVADALSRGELVELLTNYQMPRIPVFLYYHPGRYMQPKVKTWVDFMSQGLPDEL